MPCIAPIAATAMRAAIRPYSMAVAPSAFLRSLINLAISGLPSGIHYANPDPRALRKLKKKLGPAGLEKLKMSAREHNFRQLSFESAAKVPGELTQLFGRVAPFGRQRTF